MLNSNGHSGITLKGQAARQHFIQHYTGGIDVRSGVYMLAPRLLGRDIMHRAQCVLRHSLGSVLQAGNAKISHFNAAVPQNHYVLRLNIPVNDTPAVRVLQRMHDLNNKVERFPPIHLAPAGHILLERNTVNKLHDDILGVRAAGDIIYGHDIGVGQLRHGTTLVSETAADLLVFRHVRLQDLHRNHAIEPVALSLVYICHSAGADQFYDFIAIIQHFSYVLIHI